MPIKLKITWKTGKEPERVTRYMHRFAKRIKDFRPMWQLLMIKFRVLHAEYFQAESGPEGPWASYKSMKYVRWKRKQVGHVRKLRLTDQLYYAAVTATRSGGGAIRDMQPMRMRYGVNLPYARRQQYGGGGIRGRPYIGLTDRGVEEIIEMVKRYIEEQRFAAQRKAGA